MKNKLKVYDSSGNARAGSMVRSELWEAVMSNDPKDGPIWPDFMAGQMQGGVRRSLGRVLRLTFELPKDTPPQLLMVLAQLDHATPESGNKRDEGSAKD
jgi:hypothetical protein